MTQHDLTLDNQTFPNFRSDLNLALKALGSTQAGTVAPVEVATGTLWLDTSTASAPVLKIYDSGAPSNWITLGTLDAGAGTFTPAIAGLTATIAELNKLDGFTGDADDLNGLVDNIYVPATKQIVLGDKANAATGSRLTIWQGTDGDPIAVFRSGDTGTERGLYVYADNAAGEVILVATGASAGELVLKSNTIEGLRIDLSGNVDIAVKAKFPNGSSGAPSITFINDTNSGFYRSTADEIRVALGGAEHARFQSGLNNDNAHTIQTREKADVRYARAATTPGGVGTYAFLRRDTTNLGINAGTAYSGSNLRYYGTAGASGDWDAWSNGSAPSGTWEAMGDIDALSSSYSGTLFYRTA